MTLNVEGMTLANAGFVNRTHRPVLTDVIPACVEI
jgi:hypothetical protein